MTAGHLTLNDLEKLAGKDSQDLPDYESILLECKASLQETFSHNPILSSIDVNTLPASDPLSKLLEVLAYRELYVRQQINERVESCRLANAQELDLNRLASLFLSDEPDPLETVPQQVISQAGAIHTAGTVEGYKYFSYDALSPEEKSELIDVKATNPGAGVVEIILLFSRQLMLQGQNQEELDIATTEKKLDELVKKVHLRLLDNSIRPIGHKIEVRAAETVPFRITARLGVESMPGAAEVRSAAEVKVNEYISERFQFGSTIYRTGVLSALHQEGVKYIILEPFTSDVSLTDLFTDSNCAPLCELIDIKIDSFPPDEMIRSAYLNRFNRNKDGEITCELVINPPVNEIRITHYYVYWGSKAGKKVAGMPPLAIISAGGDNRTRFMDVAVPEPAESLVVHTANQNGEMFEGFPIKLPSNQSEGGSA